MKLDSNGNFFPWIQPKYGHDAYGNPVICTPGFSLVPEGEQIKRADRPFDVYAGWIRSDGFHADNKHHARSDGRWTCWQRKNSKLKDSK